MSSEDSGPDSGRDLGSGRPDQYQTDIGGTVNGAQIAALVVVMGRAAMIRCRGMGRVVRRRGGRRGRACGESVERSAGQQAGHQAGGDALADPISQAGRHQPGNLS